MNNELGNYIDLLYKAREARLAKEEEIKEMKGYEYQLRLWLINNFSKQNLEGARGKLAACGILRTTLPKVTDWDLVYEYIRETNAFELLHKRMSDKVWRDRLDNGVLVPGTEKYEDVDISLTKVR